jgi:hypothetical protein
MSKYWHAKMERVKANQSKKGGTIFTHLPQTIHWNDWLMSKYWQMGRRVNTNK